MIVASAAVLPYALELARPHRASSGDVLVRTGAWLRVELEGGPVGWGEAAPLAGHTPETATEARAELVRFAQRVVGMDAEAASALGRELAPSLPTAAAAIDGAVSVAQAASVGVSLARFFAPTPAVPRTLAISALVDDASPGEVAAAARAAVAAGHSTLKLKVGGDPEHDIARMSALRSAVGDDVAVRLDANEGWTVDEAIAALTHPDSASVEFVEDPVSGAEGFRAVASAVDVPLALDAGLRSEVDLQVYGDSLSVAVLKPSTLGGPVGTLDVASAAVAGGLHVVISSLLETAIGLTTAIHIAAAVPGELRAAGLGTGNIFGVDVAESPNVVDGRVDVPARPGLGIDVSDQVAAQLSQRGPR